MNLIFVPFWDQYLFLHLYWNDYDILAHHVCMYESFKKNDGDDVVDGEKKKNFLKKMIIHVHKKNGSTKNAFYRILNLYFKKMTYQT